MHLFYVLLVLITSVTMGLEAARQTADCLFRAPLRSCSLAGRRSDVRHNCGLEVGIRKAAVIVAHTKQRTDHRYWDTFTLMRD